MLQRHLGVQLTFTQIVHQHTFFCPVALAFFHVALHLQFITAVCHLFSVPSGDLGYLKSVGSVKNRVVRSESGFYLENCPGEGGGKQFYVILGIRPLSPRGCGYNRKLHFIAIRTSWSFSLLPSFVQLETPSSITEIKHTALRPLWGGQTLSNHLLTCAVWSSWT